MSDPTHEDYPPEYVARVLEEFKKGFDPVEAEREYRNMLENGGIEWEEFMKTLDVIDDRAKKRSA